MNKSMSKNKVLYKIFLLLQIVFLTMYAYKQSEILSPFFDEIVSITASYNFFTSGNLVVKHYYFESFSASISSGPISAIGSIIAYFFTDNLFIIRTSNFFYNLLLFNTICYFIANTFKLNFYYLAIFSNFSLILIPWWFGSLYSLGEIPSMLLFTYSIFIYNSKRNLSLFLMSLSIIFGKIFIISIFIVTIFVLFCYSKKINFTNIFFLLLPYMVFGLLIQINTDTNFYQYLQKIYNLLISHPSAGIDPIILNNIFRISELNEWSLASFGRALFTPLLFLIFIRKFSSDIEHHFNLNYLVFFTTITVPYLWFWILNDTKWIRYTQYYLIPLLFFLNIFLIKFGYKDRKYLIFYTLTLSFFMSSNLLFLMLFLISILFYFNVFDKFKINAYVVIVLIFILNSVNSFYEVNSNNKVNIDFKSCTVEIDSFDCFRNYEGNT